MRIDRIKFISALATKEMNMTELSEKIGVSRQTLYLIKAGKSCKGEIAQKIADGLQVPLLEILENQTKKSTCL